MIVTSDILALTLAGLKTDFDAAYRDAQQRAQWNMVATEIPTTLPIQNYGFLGRGATMRRLRDESVEQAVAQKQYSIADSIYRGTMKIERKAIEDDQYGLLKLRVTDLGAEPIRHWDELTFAGLSRGFSSLCYDGQYFFDTDHAEGNSGTQSNTTSASLSDNALKAAEAAMMAFVDDKGIPMGITPDTLVVGPANAYTGRTLIGSEVVVHNPGDGTVGSGATAYTPYTNVWKGAYRLVVSPYVTGYNWFLLDTKRAVKPIVIQNREDVPIVVESDMLEQGAAMREEYKFSVRGRYEQGYGLWQLAYGSNASS